MSEEHSIIITHPNGNRAGFSLLALTFTEGFEDVSSKLTLKVAKDDSEGRRHTILEDSRVIYRVDGALKLVGQVDDIDRENDNADTIEISSAENLFNYLPCQPYTYQDGTTLNAMLSDSVPSSCVGVIYWMNSGLDPAWELYSGYTYKLPGGGTTRLGSTDIYENETKLTRVLSIGAITAGTYYQDANDLYVRTVSNVDPAYRLMSAPNWRDTKVRLGVIENGTVSFPVPYKLESNKGMTEITTLLWINLQEIKWVPDVSGYVYLTSKAEIGRGSVAEPRAVFQHGLNMTKIRSTIATGQIRANSVVALGTGSGSNRQKKAVTDLVTTKLGQIWRSEILDAPACSGSMLTNLATKTLNDKRDNRVYVVSGPADWALSPGDYCKAIARDSMPAVKRIMTASYEWPENSMTLELGRRQVTFSDAFKKRLDSLRALSAMAQSVGQEWSESFHGNLDDVHPLITTFNLPSGKLDSSFASRFILRISIGYFETTTKTVVTAAHNNGGYTGNHAGYGNKDTSSEEMTAHYVPQVSAPASTNPNDKQTITINDDVTDETAIIITADLLDDWLVRDIDDDDVIGWHYGWENFEDRYGYGHNHGVATLYLHVPSAAHTHIVNAHNTNSAGDQSHGTPAEPAKSRTVQTQPATAAEVTSWLELKETGNSIHYMDFTITLNGTPVPGSPFLNKYPGDDMGGDIDMGSLVIEGNNTLIITPKDHTNPLEPVRCSVNGSISADYYISEYN